MVPVTMLAHCTVFQPLVRGAPAPFRLAHGPNRVFQPGTRILLSIHNASVGKGDAAGTPHEDSERHKTHHRHGNNTAGDGQENGHDSHGNAQHGHHGEGHHGHGGVEGAVHQVQHRAAEKSAFKFLEAVAERLTSKQVMQHVGSKVLSSAAEKAGERIGERAGERLVERLAERAGERLTERVGERVLERAGERVAERAGERLAERMGERVAERMGERMAERVAERAGERLAERAGERLAERVGERMAQRVAERAGERVAERAGERLAERAGERLAERVGERMAQRVAERAGERVAERAGERLAERAGERLAERVAERAGERMAERLGEQALTKGGTRVGAHAAEAIAGRLLEPTTAAGERTAVAAAAAVASRATEHGASAAARGAEHGASAAAAHGASAAAAHGAGSRGGLSMLDMAIQKILGSRLGRRFLTPQLLARVGRGAMVALPAVGALFVAHLAHQDYERMMEERHNGHLAAFLGFLVAFTFDVLDVLAHIVVVVGLLHQHFQVGIHVSHHVLHSVEGAGIAIAVISTVAAAAAEILAMRRGLAIANAAAAAVAAANAHTHGAAAAGGEGVAASHHKTTGKEVLPVLPFDEAVRRHVEQVSASGASQWTHGSAEVSTGKSGSASASALGVLAAAWNGGPHQQHQHKVLNSVTVAMHHAAAPEGPTATAVKACAAAVTAEAAADLATSLNRAGANGNVTTSSYAARVMSSTWHDGAAEKPDLGAPRTAPTDPMFDEK